VFDIVISNVKDIPIEPITSPSISWREAHTYIDRGVSEILKKAEHKFKEELGLNLTKLGYVEYELRERQKKIFNEFKDENFKI
jgi:hypothetical protein